MTVPRTGARVVLLDPDDRVLLIEESGSEPDGNRWHHWLTPGGGVEPGESLQTAAARELAEETGVRVQVPETAAPVHVQRRTWRWRGTTYDQTDHLFAARVAAPFEPRPLGLTAMESETVLGARWWTLDELRSTDAVMVTPDIADVVAGAAALPLPRPVLRPAGRMLLLDPDGRVLLIDTRQEPGGRVHNWIAPGGGCDPGETPAATAVRELREETGVEMAGGHDAALDEVFVEHAVFTVGAHCLDQTDHYFLTRVARHPLVRLDGIDADERAMILGSRWWSAEDLRATGELYWPVGLPDLLDTLTAARSTA